MQKSKILRWVRAFILVSFGMLGLLACGDGKPEQVTVNSAESSPISPTALATEPVTENSGAATATELMIVYTNDEHGWMEGFVDGHGSAEIVNRWRDLGCEPANCLILSGGDMWTGPAISTWFDGESMVEVMNSMGYAAAAIGNHEFDFGLEQLAANAAQSNFPFLSANIRRKLDGQTPTEHGIEPFAIVERAGVKIGIVGLTTQQTPQTTLPSNVATFDFIDYATALNEVVPQARSAGAQLIVVPGHLCSHEISQALELEVKIDMIGGGHCNELVARVTRENTAVIIGGSHLNTFATARLTLDAETAQVVDVVVDTYDNMGAEVDTEVATLVEKWRVEAAVELDGVIGYLDKSLSRRGQAMQDLITYAWLESVPSAEIAVTNLGGMRAEFAVGDLTLGDIITVMPFDNVIVEVEMLGIEFKRTFGSRPDVAIAGAYRDGRKWILEATGEPIEDEAVYVVLVSDFMYAGGDDFTGIAEADPEGYNTAIDWRQPVIDWIREMESSAENPLNPLIDELARK